jgi:predicted metal-dependent hydrolase
MKKQTGIWIDTKKAVIVFLEENNHTIKTIHSNIESRERVPGETKWFTRFGNQFLNFEKRKKNRRANKIREYLKKVVNEIKIVDGLVLFGPAGMKTELEKTIWKDTTHSPVIRAVETADSMSENQIVAWVKNYYQNKN